MLHGLLLVAQVTEYANRNIRLGRNLIKKQLMRLKREGVKFNELNRYAIPDLQVRLNRFKSLGIARGKLKRIPF